MWNGLIQTLHPLFINWITRRFRVRQYKLKINRPQLNSKQHPSYIHYLFIRQSINNNKVGTETKYEHNPLC